MIPMLNGNWNGKELIFFGTGSQADKMERLYKSYDYEVKYYCDISSQGNGSEKYNQKDVLSIDELAEYCAKHPKVTIQIASSNEEEAIEELKKRNVKASILVYNDFRFFIYSKKLEYLDKKDPSYRKMAIADSSNSRKYFTRNLAWDQLNFYNLEKDTVNIILSSPKTGSATIYESCLNAPDMIDPLYISYTMKCFSKEFLDMLSGCKKKYITGIREPISQMLSAIYYLWNTRSYLFDSMELFPGITDCQYWFDTHFMNEKKPENIWEIFSGIMETTCGEIDFYEQDYPNMTGIDLFQHSFDPEAGYTIIKEGNSEVLVYRLDKLNDLETVIGNYFNTGSFSLINSNRSEDRIYKDLYKKAFETIQIKRSFIEKVYSSKLVKWCFSDADIESFWKKWEKNIID